MENRSMLVDHLCGPTIFSHDSDEQVLTWLRHAQTMINIECRWQQTWQLFASEAEQECLRRKLTAKAA